MKKIRKIIAVLLTVLTLMSVFSAATPVLATEVTEKDALNSTLEQYKTEIENSDGKTLYEIEEERDAFTKVFKSNDGTKTAIISATPIHYKTDEGWNDIENTLVEETRVTGKVFKNKRNDFTVTIPKELSANKELQIEKGKYSISFELEGSDIFSKDKEVKGNKKSKNEKTIENHGEINTDFLDKTAEVVFENVGENTSIEYEVTSTGLKENIVLNEKPSREVVYKYKIQSKKLTASLNPDKSVTFNNSDGQAIFEIPAPIMYDAENVISDDIEVSLTGKNGKYTLIYKPSYKWLSGNITYPIVIDPVINTKDAYSGIKDAVIDSSSPDENHGDSSVLYTYKNDTGSIQSFIDIDNNSHIVKNGAKIKSVLLGLYYDGGIYIDDSTTVAVYTVTSDWAESTLTYNNKPTTINSLIDRIDINRETQQGYLLFDVTRAYTYNEETYGVCIRQRDSVTNEAMLLFSSSETTTASQKPYYIIEYYETLGLEEQFDYHTFDVGRAGTAYFNDFTEQVYIERDELGLSGINMPVQIKRYYNSNFGGTFSGMYTAYANYASFYGYGWMTNYDQFVEYKGTVDDNETILYHNDAGKVIYFEKGEANSEGQTVWNEKTDKFSNSEGYVLYIPTQYDNKVALNYKYITIKDSSGQIYEFNSSGFLTKINSADEDSARVITISYNEDGNISKVTDGVGREYRFTYTTYEEWLFPLLTSIQVNSPSGSAITVTHNGSNVPYKVTYTYTFSDYFGLNEVPILSSATYPDGETVYYTVNDNLISLKNIDGYAVEFAFNDSNTVISEKVYKETEIVNGGQLTITDENSYEKTYVDLNGTKITKQFDMYGRTINTKNNNNVTESVPHIYSDDYKAQGSVSYSFYNTYEQDLTGNETNLVTNGSFTTNLSGWTISDSAYVKRNSNADYKKGDETPGYLQLKCEPDEIQYAEQIIDIENGVAGDEYRLDYFVKNTNHSHMATELALIDTIIVEARENVEGTETWETVAWVDSNPFNDNWQKYSYAFDVDFEYNEIRIIVAFYFQYGTAWYDDISLVKTYQANVIQNPDTETDNENTGSSDDNSNTIGCGCNGCNTPDCPCTVHSDTCTEPTCNRGYNFENNSSGITFSLTDGEKTMAMEQTVSGNYYGSQKDLNGIYTGYSYDQMNGQLEYMTDANYEITNFYYDAMSRLNRVSNNNVSGLTNSDKMETSYSYENDRIKSITHNDFSYNYEYDAWGNPTAVKVGEQELVSYTYDSADKTRDRINCITYGNGDYTDYTYNDDGNIEKIKSYSADDVLVADYEYFYDNNGQITEIKNKKESTVIRYSENGYEYVALKADGTDDFIIYSKNIETDEDEKEIPVEILGGLRYTENKGMVDSNSAEGTTTNSGSVETPSNLYSFSSTKDYFGRTEQKETNYLTVEEEGIKFSIKSNDEYLYADKKNAENETTSLVSSYKITRGIYIDELDETLYEEFSVGLLELSDKREYIYEYDDKGNIIRIRLKTFDAANIETVTELCSYIYDEVGQLVRENNAELNKTVVYVYDKGGNIAQKKEYAYSTGELGDAVSIINYTYDSVWKDKLTAYGNTQIQTDAMGNPLNYVRTGIDGVTSSANLEWNGRQLSAVTVGAERYEYTYNADGLRTSVKEYFASGKLSKTYYYIWENGKLTGYLVKNASDSNGIAVKLLFDTDGESIGYEVKEINGSAEECFYFQKNLQGDIIAVFEQDGTEVLTYSYDAWGGVEVAATDTSTSAGLIAYLCTPITYRGYNYDVFTGLYYLQSRYYNPTYGRFLNADTTEILEATQGTPLGANLFAYCNNNPVNMVDYSGMLGVVGTILLVFFLLIVLYLAADFWCDVYFEWLLDKLFDSVPGLSTVLSLWDAVSFIDDVNDKYWMCFSVFAAHAKNIIDYGKNINLNPTYPGYDDYEYKIMCKNAYELAVENTSLTANDTWESLGPDGQYLFVHEMAAYDESMYHNLLLLVYRDLIVWGQDKVKDFFKGIVQIFLP